MNRRFFFKHTINSLGVICLAPSLMESLMTDPSRLEKNLPELENLALPDIIPVPDDPQSWIQFREFITAWRKEAKSKVSYNDQLYKDPEFQWVSSAYNCYFLMMYDELFYNWKEGKYTVDQFLSESEKDFGRIDIVVLWHAYPRIGLDDRNQFDFYREMPGGLEELRKISSQFHQRGVKVYINYNPWDTGTRREKDHDIEVLTQMIKSMDADGIFLDTMAGGAKVFREKLDEVKPGVVLESELALPVENVWDHHMSWAQWFGDGKAPGILRNKWFERRHMQHGISRWERDRTKELQTAWMNGSGIMIWENVFGQWVGWNERDKSMLRAISPIQKRWSNLFSGEGWIPMADETPLQNVYANLWLGEGIRLWTIVNRSEETIEGDILHFEMKEGESYFDLIQGKEISPQKKLDHAVVKGKLTPRGLACILAGTVKALGEDFQSFLNSQARINQLSSYNTDFPALKTSQLSNVPTQKKTKSLEGMVKIPTFKGNLDVQFRVREVGFYSSIDPTFVNIGAPALHHRVKFTQEVNLEEFWMDETPVTNLQYQQFLKHSKYVPKERSNFLKHWADGKIPIGKENHPVVYVSLEDARAYAAWSSKRLPSEQEWQFAGQGFDKYNYPWGQKMLEGVCNSGELGDTSAVKAFPNGKSIFGCFDLCGNTWELTESEHSDGRNRFCVLKGGCFYKAITSDWYFDGGPQPLNFAAKQLLIYPGIDRCSTIGFRCAADI